MILDGRCRRAPRLWITCTLLKMIKLEFSLVLGITFFILQVLASSREPRRNYGYGGLSTAEGNKRISKTGLSVDKHSASGSGEVSGTLRNVEDYSQPREGLHGEVVSYSNNFYRSRAAAEISLGSPGDSVETSSPVNAASGREVSESLSNVKDYFQARERLHTEVVSYSNNFYRSRAAAEVNSGSPGDPTEDPSPCTYSDPSPNS